MSKVIKLGNYKGIEFKVEKVPVSNEEVEQQIQMILAQSSQTEEKDGEYIIKELNKGKINNCKIIWKK